MGDVLVLFEVGGVKRFAGALTSSAAKGETFQAWYMEGDAKGLYCLDASTTRSDVRTLNRECIVTKVHTYARTHTHTRTHLISHTCTHAGGWCPRGYRHRGSDHGPK